MLPRPYLSTLLLLQITQDSSISLIRPIQLSAEQIVSNYSNQNSNLLHGCDYLSSQHNNNNKLFHLIEFQVFASRFFIRNKFSAKNYIFKMTFPCFEGQIFRKCAYLDVAKFFPCCIKWRRRFSSRYRLNGDANFLCIMSLSESTQLLPTIDYSSQ